MTKLRFLSLIFVSALLMSSDLMSQIASPSLPWMNTDTVLDDRQLMNRHALLVFDWNIQSNRIEEVGIMMDELTRDFDWLSIVGIHRAQHSEELDLGLIQRRAKSLGLNFPLQIDTLKLHEKNRRISFDLYGPDVDIRQEGLSLNEKHLKNLRQVLSEMKKEFNSPGRVLFPVNPSSGNTSMQDLNLLKEPNSICYDSRYGRLNISDTGHDRVIICSPTGEVFECIGSGIKGNGIGEFGDTQFDRPMGLAHHKDSSILFIADFGNKRILMADVDRFMTSELEISDQDGYRITLPDGPTDLSIDGNVLSITLPGSQQVWTVDIISKKLIDTFGSGPGSSSFSKKSSKLILGHPRSAVSLNERSIIWDRESGNVVSMDDIRARPLISPEKDLIDKYGGRWDTSYVHLSRIKSHNGYAYAIEGLKNKILEIDPEEGSVFPLDWNSDSVDVGQLQDMCWTDEMIYLLDSEKGQIIIKGEGYTDYLRLSNIQRLRTGRFRPQHFFVAEELTLSSTVQSTIKIEFSLPDGLMLHPEYESDVFKSAGSTIYMENSDIKAGPIEIIAFPDMEKNQINLMGDIYLSPTSSPWICYRRMIQISIPITKDAQSLNQELKLSFDLTEKLSAND